MRSQQWLLAMVTTLGLVVIALPSKSMTDAKSVGGRREGGRGGGDCALLFFGLARSFKAVALPSILKQIVKVNQDCDLYAHTYNVSAVTNDNMVNQEKNAPVFAEDVQLMSPHLTLVMDTDAEFHRARNITYFRQFFPIGMKWVWPAGMDNMIKQWHSIERVWAAMTSSGKQYRRVGLFRLDCKYNDPIDISRGAAVVPAWQNSPPTWMNDRIFYGEYQHAQRWATGRFPHFEDYAQRHNFQVHSEMFLADLFKDVPLTTTAACLDRVRATGMLVKGDCQNQPNWLEPAYPGAGAVATCDKDGGGENCAKGSQKSVGAGEESKEEGAKKDVGAIFSLAQEHHDKMAGASGDPAKELREGGPGAYHVHKPKPSHAMSCADTGCTARGDTVHKALEYFKQRAETEHESYGQPMDIVKIDEERYQAMVKVGELCERWLWDYDCSLDWWSRALAMDPDRAEAGFYLGQHFRLRRGEFKKALGYLRKAFALPVPNRFWLPFMSDLYGCLVPLELLQTMEGLDEAVDTLSGAVWKDVKKARASVVQHCGAGRDVAKGDAAYDKAKRMRERTKREKEARESKERKESKKARKGQEEGEEISKEVGREGEKEEEPKRSREEAREKKMMGSSVKYGGLQHAALLVQNLERAVEFYTQVLGMRDETYQRPDLQTDGAVIAFGTSQIHLMELPALSSTHRRSELGDESHRPELGESDRHLAVTVRDIGALTERLTAHGVAFSTASVLGSKAIFCRDPDMNELEFVEGA